MGHESPPRDPNDDDDDKKMDEEQDDEPAVIERARRGRITVNGLNVSLVGG